MSNEKKFWLHVALFIAIPFVCSAFGKPLANFHRCNKLRLTLSFQRTISRFRVSSDIAVASVEGELSMNDGQQGKRVRTKIRLDNGNEASIISRTVALTQDWHVTVYELERPASINEHYWEAKSLDFAANILDPFGLVTWPGSVIAAQELQHYTHQIQNSTVLVLGAGPGVEALSVAMLGAKHVIATDIHPTTLQLLDYGAKQAGLDDQIKTRVFDLFSEMDLPKCDIVIVADVMYDAYLGKQVGRRMKEVLRRATPPKILITDSQRFAGTDFLPDLNKACQSFHEWETRTLANFTGSGVMVNEDQTYNVTARVLCIGWDKP
mmetsp:Transcript_18236/g.28176  ORF Transcript_18236/g.28176 Transcript_18236/m.28176 type:complete len:322 (+) Transcript_18236:1385-2350(+)